MKITGIPNNYDDYDHPRYIWRTAQLCLNHQPNGFVETALKWMQGPLVKHGKTDWCIQVIIPVPFQSFMKHWRIYGSIHRPIMPANECHCKFQAQNWQSKSKCSWRSRSKDIKSLGNFKKGPIPRILFMSRQICPFLFADHSVFLEKFHSGLPWDNQDFVPYFRS